MKTKIRFHNEIFYKYELPFSLNDSERQFSYSTVLLEVDKVHLLDQIWPVNIKKVKNRLRSNHSCCYLTIDNEKPIAYHWVQFKGWHYFQQAGKKVNIDDENIFIIYHTRVSEAYQGQGINRYIIKKILTDFQLEGFKYGIIYTSSKNIANRVSLERIGFKKYFKFRSIQVNNTFIPLQTKIVV